MRKNWLPEVALLCAVVLVTAYAVNSFNSGDIESAQDREAACVSGSRSMQIELEQTKKSLQAVGEEKDAAEYRLTVAENQARELKRQLDDIQVVKDTLGEIVDAVKESNKKAKSRKLPPSTRSVPQPKKALPIPAETEPAREGEETADGYAERMVKALNKVRRDHLVGPVTWSSELSEAAGVWGRELIKNGCTLKHDPATKHGENLAKSYRTPEAAVAEWAGEEKDYDYSSNTCADGKVCGHYTQIVWADTTEVGCQQYDCPADKQPVLVCRFFPAGNVIGQKPY
jgi:pathogenesis-related protein 1